MSIRGTDNFFMYEQNSALFYKYIIEHCVSISAYIQKVKGRGGKECDFG